MECNNANYEVRSINIAATLSSRHYKDPSAVNYFQQRRHKTNRF